MYTFVVHYVLFTSGVSIVLMPSRSLKSKSRTGNGPSSLVHLLVKMVTICCLFARVRDLAKITMAYDYMITPMGAWNVVDTPVLFVLHLDFKILDII